MEDWNVNQVTLEAHQQLVSLSLSWTDIEEGRRAYLSDYNNVVRALADSSPDDWALVRAAVLHIRHCEELDREHNRWLRQKILASFENEARGHLYYLTMETRRDCPVPRIDPEDMFPAHRMTGRELTYYYSRFALAVLVGRDDPNRAIELFEELDSSFDPQIRYVFPSGNRGLYLEWKSDRLPGLYEMVGRFEDALNFTAVSFGHPWLNVPSHDIAVRRIVGWLGQLRNSGGVSEVERCLDLIYAWLDGAADVDDEERQHVGDCGTATRQFWAWFYGNALGRLLAARTSLRASLLDEIEAGEWDNCWHAAGILFEAPPESWSEYRKRALKFYNSSDIEYRPQGPMPWNAMQPPHLSAQSDLYWAMRVGFAEAYSQGAEARRLSLSDIADSLGRIETTTSSTGQHVLRTERNTDRLLQDMEGRLPPSREYWRQRLLELFPPSLIGKLPWDTIDYLIDASRHRSGKEWDHCIVSLCKSVESLFVRILIPGIRVSPGASQLTLVIPRGKGAPRRCTERQWGRFSISDWSKVLGTLTEGGINEPLGLALLHAFPNADLNAVVKLNIDLARMPKLRGSSAHDSATADARKINNAEELWTLVVGNSGEGVLAKFCSALGLTEEGSVSRDGNACQ